MELFVIIVNGYKPLTTITKSSILDVAAVLDPQLLFVKRYQLTVTILFYFCITFILKSFCEILSAEIQK